MLIPTTKTSATENMNKYKIIYKIKKSGYSKGKQDSYLPFPWS